VNNLVLSVFPGIDLLGRAFEEEGYCIVRGPDVIWGADIKEFHPPAGIFEGIISGPPCQFYSSAAMNMRKAEKDLLAEFERVVSEAIPEWFLMENTRRVREVNIDGYFIHNFLWNNRWCADGNTGPEQNRLRRFQFGCKKELKLQIESVAIFQNPKIEWAVTATEISKGRPGHGPYSGRHKRRSVEKILELMGLLGDFFGDESPFTMSGKGLLLGNAVPMPMGRSIARAIRKCFTIGEK